eukprot:g6262.t1
MAQTDRDALLLALFNATDGPSWRRKTNWNTDVALSDWFGVSLNGEGFVVKLHLAENNLRGSIPTELGDLRALKELYLEDNQLTGTIPKELGKLTALQGLSLAGNQLSGPIPKELGALSKLEQLWLHNNGLTGHIPRQLGDLSALQHLYLSANKLDGLWDCGTRATGRDDNIECHAGGGIPTELNGFLDFLEGLHLLHCEGNPWVEPPAALLGRVSEAPNFSAIRSYFVDLYREKRVISRSLKVVLVGKEGTGKTSLRQSIAAGRAVPTAGPADSTVHMTIQDTTLGGVSVRILDCAGQVAYYGLLQLFLTNRAVYLLVWDVSQEGRNGTVATSATEDLKALGILPWLSALSFRLPGGDVILVGNKCDLRSGARDTAARAASRVESACRRWLARVRLSGGRAVEIEQGTSLTSCAQPGWRAYLASSAWRVLAWISGYKMGWPCDWSAGTRGGDCRPSLVDRILRVGGDGPFRAEEMVLPESWGLALSFLRDLRDNGRNDTEAVARDRTLSREDSGAVSYGMVRSELFLLWEKAVRERSLSVPNPTSAFEGALTIREHEGTVLSVGTYVFLDVDWLAKVLEPVLNHKGIEDGTGARTFGDVEVIEQWQEYSLRKLQDEGILEQRLAAFLWPGYTKHVLAALERIGLTFPRPGDKDGGLVVPLRLPETRPPYVGQHIANFNDDHGQRPLTMHWKMPYGVPPGGVERIVSRCSSLGEASLFWRFGVLVRVGATEIEGEGDDDVERSWFLLEYDSYGQELVIAVWGDLKEAVAWATLSSVFTVIRDMTLQYPGLRWEAFVGCPDHPGEAMCISETCSRGDRLVAEEHICQQCGFAGKKRGGAAYLVSELLLVDGVDDTTGEMFRRLVGRISELQSASLSPGATPGTTPPEMRGRSIDDQAAEQLEEISRRITSAVSPVLDRELKTWAANLRNLRLHVHEDVQRIVDESNKKALEAVAAVGAHQSAERKQMAKEIMQAVANLGTDQSEGRRWLAREVARLTVRIPSHAVLLPPREDESLELTDAEREATSWTQRLKDWRAQGKKAGKRVATKEYRLFFLCGHDHSLVECGFDGKGYLIECPRKWLRSSLPVMKALLIVVNVALKTVAGLSIPADGIASVGDKAWDEILSSTVEGAAEASLDAACSAAEEGLDQASAMADSLDETAPAHDYNVGGSSNASRPLPTPREATTMLETLVSDLSIKGLKKSGDDAGRRFLCFDTTMQLVDKAGQGKEWSWVRNKNVQAFTAEAGGGRGRPI